MPRFETGICDLNGFCGFSAERGYYSPCIRRSNGNQYIAFILPWLWLLGVGQQLSSAMEGYGSAAIMLSVCETSREMRLLDIFQSGNLLRGNRKKKPPNQIQRNG